MSAASDKLARSRLAIIEHVYRKELRKDAQQEPPAPNNGTFSRVKRAARRYWHHHPARMGLQMATPLLASYAREHPSTYVSIAAVAGAVFMIARPWRLISVGGIALALAKSPQFAGMLMSAMAGGDWDDEF